MEGDTTAERRLREVEKRQALRDQHCEGMTRIVMEVHGAICGDPTNGARGIQDRLRGVEETLAHIRRERREEREEARAARAALKRRLVAGLVGLGLMIVGMVAKDAYFRWAAAGGATPAPGTERSEP
jgi:hypothetical protein